MFCRNYRKLGITPEGNYLIDAEIVADSVPSPLPTDGTDIENIGYPADKVKFAPGSVLFAVEDNAVFVANEDGVFCTPGEPAPSPEPEPSGDSTLDLTCFKYSEGYEGYYDYYTDTPPDNWESLDANTLFDKVSRECNLPEGLEQKIVAYYNSFVNGDDSLVKQITTLSFDPMFTIDTAGWVVYPSGPYTASITGYSLFDGKIYGENHKGLTFIHHNDDEGADEWYIFGVDEDKVTGFWVRVQWQ